MHGFRINKKNTFIERTSFDNNIISLLGRGDGIEIMTQTITKDKLFYVYPSDDPNVLEFFYILKGRIECDHNGVKTKLGPHDYYSAQGIEEPVHFKVLSEVTYIWITTEPSFLHLSDVIADLLKVVQQVEKKDSYTYLHSERVAEYSVKIAKQMKLNKEQLENLYIASMLHDIGKINIPEEILNKPGKLTDEEFVIVKQHSAEGAEMVKHTHYCGCAQIIEQHHERLNGSGYPHQLKGDEIGLEARIIAVSDTYDAMTEERAYRKAFSPEFAFSEIKSMAITHYDEKVVDAFESVLREEGILRQITIK